MVGGACHRVDGPVDYVVAVEVLHSFEELFHEAFNCDVVVSMWYIGNRE
jgi:hypothetical protein